MRSPYTRNAGHTASIPAKLGGWIVVYDRSRGFELDADDRWIVMHEPSTGHISIKSREKALFIMHAVANADSISAAQVHADILPRE